MAAEPPSPFFGTQARILMAEWQSLAKLIVSHSTQAKDKPITHIEELESFDIENLENLTFSAPNELPHTLAEKNIRVALQGPFGALLKNKMTAYAQISRIRLEINLMNNELFKNRRIPQSEDEEVLVKKLQKLDVSQLDKMQNELDNLTNEHHSQWQEFIQYWTEQLLKFLEKSKLNLTEREIKELYDEDIASELLPRFIEIGLKLPEKDYPTMNFADYLYLKAMLTLQSALSRQHLAHDETEIHQRLRGFKSELAQMKKQEQEFLERQKQETQAIMAPLG